MAGYTLTREKDGRTAYFSNALSVQESLLDLNRRYRGTDLIKTA